MTVLMVCPAVYALCSHPAAQRYQIPFMLTVTFLSTDRGTVASVTVFLTCLYRIPNGSYAWGSHRWEQPATRTRR